ncbi:cell wall protein DAN4-like [Arapaima gigas]
MTARCGGMCLISWCAAVMVAPPLATAVTPPHLLKPHLTMAPWSLLVLWSLLGLLVAPSTCSQSDNTPIILSHLALQNETQCNLTCTGNSSCNSFVFEKNECYTLRCPNTTQCQGLTLRELLNTSTAIPSGQQPAGSASSKRFSISKSMDKVTALPNLTKNQTQGTTSDGRTFTGAFGSMNSLSGSNEPDKVGSSTVKSSTVTEVVKISMTTLHGAKTPKLMTPTSPPTTFTTTSPPMTSTTTSPPTTSTTLTSTSSPTTTTTTTKTPTTTIKTNMTSSTLEPPAVISATPKAKEMPSQNTQKTVSDKTTSRSITTGPGTSVPSTSPSKGVKGTTKAILDIPADPLTRQLVDTSSLLAIFLFGLVFFVVSVVLFLTQAYESYKKKDYTQVDYLINGMYSDSGV